MVKLLVSLEPLGMDGHVAITSQVMDFHTVTAAENALDRIKDAYVAHQVIGVIIDVPASTR